MPLIQETLLGLLAVQPMHGYELKLSLDGLFSRTQIVNVGQVYTALGKLDRDGDVEEEFGPQGEHMDRRVYRITEKGRKRLDGWLVTPVSRTDLRDEVYLKLALARRTQPDTVPEVLRAQRGETLQQIQNLTLLTQRLGDKDHEARLLIQGAVLHLEADLQWLDLWEEDLGRGGKRQ